MNKGFRNALLSLWVLTIAGLGFYFGGESQAAKNLRAVADSANNGARILSRHEIGGRSDSPMLSTTFVISQIYTHGGSSTAGTLYAADYVELKNISGTSQSLNGLSIYYGSATGQFASSTTNIVALPNTSVPAGGYFLIQTGTVGSAGVALPVTPDVITTNAGLGASGGKVALVNGLAANSCGATATPCNLPNSQIIDLVSYGSANNAEGGGAVPVLTNTTGARRKASGCSETDNNLNDFEIISNPVPRSSSATPASCVNGLTISMPASSSVPGTTISVPINVGDTTGKDIQGINAVISFDSSIVQPAGATGISRVGTLLALDGEGFSPYTINTNIGTPGQISIAIAWGGAGPKLSGSGVLINLRFVVQNNAGVTSPLGFSSFTINEGAVPALTTNGSLTVNVPYRPLGDFNGDGKTDFSILRPGTSPASTQWWTAINGTNAASAVNFGQSSDYPINADFDGDGKADIAIWRPESGAAYFWILESSTSTVRLINFGLPGDDPSVVGDYDGDGKADPAVYRCPASVGQCFFYYQGSRNNPSGGITFIPFGNSAGNPVPLAGDYDGDGKFDFTVAITSGSNRLYVTRKSSNGGIDWNTYGLTTDVLIPRADYDGDGKTDIVIARPIQNGQTSNYQVWIRRSDNGASEVFTFGLVGDYVAFGDYDGDGRTDAAIWREGAQGAPSGFWIRYSSTGAATFYQFGTVGDYPTNDWVMPGE